MSQQLQCIVILCAYFVMSIDIIEHEMVILQLMQNEMNGDSGTWTEEPTCDSLTIICDSEGHVLFLSLTERTMSGIIPSEINQLTFIEFLYLDRNMLSGTIPETIGDLPNCGFLRLDSNKLTGGIPETLGNLAKMEFLYLQENELSGTIPNALGDLSALQFLDLHDNRLTGPIPKSIEDIGLMFLFLADNPKLFCTDYETWASTVNDYDDFKRDCGEDCFSGGIAGDIYGIGLGVFSAPSLVECEHMCLLDDRCEAIQYSKGCVFGCDANCVVHATKTIDSEFVDDYYVYYRQESCYGICYTSGLETDIPGQGFRQLNVGSLSDCQSVCSSVSGCVAIQYSESCELGCEKRCLLHDSQTHTGNLFMDFYVHWPKACGPDICFTEPLSTDILGTGFMITSASSMADCQSTCISTNDCLAVQYSQSCAFGTCDQNCFLHNNQDIMVGYPLVSDFYVSLAGNCDSCCISDPIPADIPGFGVGAFEAASLAQCQDTCCKHPICRAVQYSEGATGGPPLNCVLLASQNVGVMGNAFLDYLTYFVSPKKISYCDDCCYSSPQTGDIVGLGIVAFVSPSLSSCQSACCANPKCAAIQFSETCSAGCEIRCVLHGYVEITDTQPADYLVYIRESCTEN